MLDLVGGRVGLLLLALLLCGGVGSVLSEGNGAEDDTKADRECEDLFHLCNSPLIKKNMGTTNRGFTARLDRKPARKLVVVLLIGGRVGLLLLLAHFLRGVGGVLREGNGAEDNAEAKSKYEKLFHAWWFS